MNWHWLFCRWSKWTDVAQGRYVIAGQMMNTAGERWIEQMRRCEVCGKVQLREARA